MKKRTGFACFILAVGLLVSANAPLFVVSAADTPAGSGEPGDPYIITEKGHLRSIGDHPEAAFRLEADLVLEDADFEPGGPLYREDADSPRFAEFRGTLDGNRHTITGYKLDVFRDGDLGVSYTAMFGSNYGTIKNLNLENLVYDLNEYDNPSEQICFTPLVVNNYGTIENCTLKTLVAFDFFDADASSVTYGGFALYNHGQIKSCGALADVLIAAKTVLAGGIAASNDGTIQHSYNTGDITTLSESVSAGGITADNGGTVEECYNHGYLRAQIDSQAGIRMIIGGIAARNLPDGAIRNCFNTGTLMPIVSAYASYVAGTDEVAAGGIAGKNESSASILYCYSSGLVSELNLAGDLPRGLGAVAGSNSGAITAVAADYGVPAVPGNPDHAVLKSVAEMKTAGAYAGFDFASVYDLPAPGGDFNLPVLRNTPFRFEKRIAGLVIQNLPNTLSYTDEQLADDTILTPGALLGDGLDLRYRYNNTDIGGSAITDFGVLMTALWYGPNTVYLYAGQDDHYFVTSLTVEIIPSELSSIQVDADFVKTDYVFGIDQSLDLTGAMLQLNYLDGSVRIIPLTANYITDDISGILLTPGLQKPININFFGYQTVLYINVFQNTVESDVYTLRPSTDEAYDAFIRVAPNTTVQQLISGIHQQNYVTVYMGDSPVYGDTKLSTGAKLVYSYNNQILHTVGIAVAGDLNSSGTVTITDLVLLQGHILQINNLTGLAALAADLNNNGGLTITDLVLVQSYILGIANIS